MPGFEREPKTSVTLPPKLGGSMEHTCFRNVIIFQLLSPPDQSPRFISQPNPRQVWNRCWIIVVWELFLFIYFWIEIVVTVVRRGGWINTVNPASLIHTRAVLIIYQHFHFFTLKTLKALKCCLSPNSHHFIPHPTIVIFCVYFLWKTSDANSQPRGWAGSAAPPYRSFFSALCHLSLWKAFKGEAELCTLRFVGVFSGLACFVFNRTDWFSP